MHASSFGDEDEDGDDLEPPEPHEGSWDDLGEVAEGPASRRDGEATIGRLASPRSKTPTRDGLHRRPAEALRYQ